MEPAIKRRRHGSSAQKDIQDEDDDDELASHPQEIRIRRDPDIQLALKRANADHKLKSTMAHIIEKYSRNFEGIGDEIDMVTGEIVVNNGHLRSMRDEGDVEGLWMEGDSNVDEDDGILLEDLTDEYSENEVQVNEVRDSQSDDENSQVSTTEKQDTGPSPQADHPGSSFDPELRDDPFGPPAFGPSTSLGYGPPPGFGPWGLMPGFPMQHWGRDDIPPYFNMPQSMPGPWYTGGRYDFPTNNGQTSIWGRSWVKRTKRVGSMKGSSKRSSDEQTGNNTADERAETTQSSVSLKSQGKEPRSTEFPASDRTINATDEDDDLILSGTTEPVPATNSNLAPSGGESSVKRQDQKAHTERDLQEIGGNSVEQLHQNDETDNHGRRRSGRARKQTEYMGKVSWKDAKEWQKSCQTLSVELYQADPSLRETFRSVDQIIDNADEKGALPPKKTQAKELASNELDTGVAFQKQVIPDSQDTATPFNSSAPEPSQSKGVTNGPADFGQSAMPATELSDDEAPLVLSRIKAPKRHVETLNQTPVSAITTPYQDMDIEPVVSRMRSPAKVTQGVTPRAETSVVDVFDQATQSLKRKRGRPKGSTANVKPVSPVVVGGKTTGGETIDSCPNLQKRRGRRPRRPEVATPKAQAEDRHESPGTTHGDVAEENSKDKDTDGETPEVSAHLSHELRWLLKTKPDNCVSRRARDSASEELLRSRESKEKHRKREHDQEKPIEKVIAVPKEVMHETREVADQHPAPQRLQEWPPQADVIMEEDNPAQDGQSDSDTSAFPSHDNEPSDNGDTASGQASPNNDTSSDHGFLDEQPPAYDDVESLPGLLEEVAVQGTSTPRKPKDTIAPLPEAPSSSQRPHTPRHTSIHTTRAPSSRRSLLSFVSDSESDTDGSRDELTRRVKSMSTRTSARPSTRKVWRATALTREVHKTPSKRCMHDMSSPVSAVKTPGGTMRTCGVDGYQCGRDYCFTCI
ncbi:hypothetical protein FHETE_9967 [Fusarium heterosporum]|uniref:Uncharacterized protein n=1 Tax=Fusarium heterosporum TaxID=42747 RepID=A0A8H5SWC5_FUSHE|nr:hypothetical protein FHETE_9967 [Fusarium heterosporum]